jgi:hypothetical protein
VANAAFGGVYSAVAIWLPYDAIEEFLADVRRHGTT